MTTILDITLHTLSIYILNYATLRPRFLYAKQLQSKMNDNDNSYVVMGSEPLSIVSSLYRVGGNKFELHRTWFEVWKLLEVLTNLESLKSRKSWSFWDLQECRWVLKASAFDILRAFRLRLFEQHRWHGKL